MTLFTLAIFLAGIWLLSLYAGRMLHNDIAHQLERQQLATTSLLAAQIGDELNERLTVLKIVADSLGAIDLKDTSSIQRLLEDRPIFIRYFNSGVYVTGLDGTAVASVPASLSRVGINYIDRDYIATPLKEKKAKIGQPVLGKTVHSAVVGIGMPIKDASGQVVGVLAGVIDLAKPSFLDKVTESSYGKSGYYQLLESKSGLIITSTNKQQLMQKSVQGENQQLQGTEKAVISVNALGEEVLSSSKHIPVADWLIVASLPTVEAFAPIYSMERRILLVTILLTIVAGGLTWWMLRRELSPMLATAKQLADMSNSDQQLRPLMIHSQNEIGELVSGFNTLLKALWQREDNLRIAAAAFESQEGMIVTDADRVILRVNNAFTRITGFSADEAIGNTPKILGSGLHDKAFYEAMWATINQSGAWEGEVWNRRKNGEAYLERLIITAVKNDDGKVINYVATMTDITTSKEASEEIHSLAFYDPLTHLPNRRLLLDRLKQALAASTRSNRYGALLFLDLDHFKTLNDTLGHDMGDLLLKQVSVRLSDCVRKVDTVARIGGDEFVVLLENLSGKPIEAAAQTEIIAAKIQVALGRPFNIGGHEHFSAGSIGATLFLNQEKASVEVILKQADIAMYQAKDSGRNAIRFFDQDMQDAVNARANLESELRTALSQKQFQLYFQPQVNQELRPFGAEVLIRWRHPQLGLVLPGEFIQLAEDTGLILSIGQWVLDAACEQLKKWQDNPYTQKLTLSVNVSARQFRQADFVEQVKSVITRNAINPSLLKLELTESILFKDINGMIATMQALRKIGIGFELDDFGTGYSSLQYLKKLPLSQLKIDQSFVRDIAVDSSDRTLVLTIIKMAHSLGLEVIAEGVETQEQLEFLKSNGCDRYQGYLFSKPLPVDKFELLLQQTL